MSEPTPSSWHITVRIAVPRFRDLLRPSEFKVYLVALLVTGGLPLLLLAETMLLVACAPSPPGACFPRPPAWVESMAEAVPMTFLPALLLMALVYFCALFSQTLSFRHFRILLLVGLPLAAILCRCGWLALSRDS
jgi:hypothetical protein